MGVTRQTAHQGRSTAWVHLGLLEQAPDPASAWRRRPIRRAPEGSARISRADLVLRGLEETLAERIGRDAVASRCGPRWRRRGVRRRPATPEPPAPRPGGPGTGARPSRHRSLLTVPDIVVETRGRPTACRRPRCRTAPW